MQAKNGSPSAEKPLLHAPPARPDGAKTVVRLMERRFLVALSVTLRTATVKHNFAGGVSIQSLGVRVVIVRSETTKQSRFSLDFRRPGDCFAALAMTISTPRAQWLLGGHSSTGKQNDVILAE